MHDNIPNVNNTVEPPNNGHVGDECFVHYSEVVPSLEVLSYIQLLAGGTQFIRCREVVRSSECPLSEVPLYYSGIVSCKTRAGSRSTFDIQRYKLEMLVYEQNKSYS